MHRRSFLFFFFFNDTATTEIYTLSLHDALPIFPARPAAALVGRHGVHPVPPHAAHLHPRPPGQRADRKSTRLNSSHANISYAVFCLKKKKKTKITCSVTSHSTIKIDELMYNNPR